MVRRLHLYMNNPTAGGVDGTEISGGDGSLPLTFNLNASANESKAKICAVRCESGYSIEGGCEIYFTGASAGKWTVALNDFSSSEDPETMALDFANWENAITIDNVSTVNSVFWVRATSSSLESPQNDTSVILHADGEVVEING